MPKFSDKLGHPAFRLYRIIIKLGFQLALIKKRHRMASLQMFEELNFFYSVVTAEYSEQYRQMNPWESG